MNKMQETENLKARKTISVVPVSANTELLVLTTTLSVKFAIEFKLGKQTVRALDMI